MVKKYLYYAAPFIILPILMLLCEILENSDLIPMSVYVIVAICILFSAVMGNLTPTRKMFDYIMTIVMPLSFFCVMFLAGLFAEGCDGSPKLYVHDALDVAFQPIALQIYLMMGVVTFLASFRAIRVVKMIKSH